MDSTNLKANPVCPGDAVTPGADTSSLVQEADDHDDRMVVVGGSLWTWEDYMALMVPDDFYDTGQHDDHVD